MLGPACSHGVRWDDPCKECEIVSLRETIEVFEPKVIRAKQRLAELTQPTPETPVTLSPSEERSFMKVFERSPRRVQETPADLVGALQDKAHTDAGPFRAGRSVKETGTAPQRTCSWAKEGNKFNCHTCGSFSVTTLGRDEIIADCQHRPTANRRNEHE